eukprot:Blabericola_migrator_1__147@NODE_1039_length_5629_cov_110_027508_g715_i0_p2_GENE_NODE_1039_length_5629_cov_110_027508_g715_i0NODE_1039_length_5629_cov_110_027508_g715_i0_p2_ORF_typecomplete_len513_score73_65LUC7/PF03194_15/1_8e75FdhE/PF04216_12/0_0013GRP/PF07172_11/0_021ZnC2H2_12/PF18112_1/0_061KMP11/PF03037_16/0_047KMP11/PF03037_16/9e03DUF4407/PF14362_6/0_38LPP/PF04728_13/38LPP/PF04728_13/14Antiadapt_IraP/PF10796_9/3_1e02Antiadapt_IraP/PF10796_9/0_61kleA_kleC/PF17383_2/1_1e04kleA_kleC/PF17383_2
MDEMRALLDTLLGADRNALPEQRQNRQQRFNDSDVCRYFLVDFCPHDLFPNTRSDLGPCNKIHSDSLKEQYQKSPDREHFAVEYEAEFISFLEKLIEQAEQKIEKANRRIDAPLPDNALLSEEQQQQVDKLNEEISRLLGEAEKAGERGDVEEAAVLTRQVQQLRREADRAASSLYGSYMQREKSLRVCPICGAMQSVGDSMSRFESHVTGKQHQGFEKIRSCLEELKRRRAERQKQRSSNETLDARSGGGGASAGGRYSDGGGHYGRGPSNRGGNEYGSSGPHRNKAPRYDDMRRSKRPRWWNESGSGEGWNSTAEEEVDRDSGPRRDVRSGGQRDNRSYPSSSYWRESGGSVRRDTRSPSPVNSGRHQRRRNPDYRDIEGSGEHNSRSYDRDRGGGPYAVRSSVDSSGGHRNSRREVEHRSSSRILSTGQRSSAERGSSGRVMRSAAATHLDAPYRGRPSDDGEPEEGEYLVLNNSSDKYDAAPAGSNGSSGETTTSAAGQVIEPETNRQ